ncbi:MAG: hypothetical protein ACP5I4_00655 [Oceanipulchritudo sp.]
MLLTTAALVAAPFLNAQTSGGIGGGVYTDGVLFENLVWYQRGNNPDAIVQLEVIDNDTVFTGEALRVVTQNGSDKANAFSTRLAEPVALEEGDTLKVSFNFRYVPPLLFGTPNQDIYATRVGAYLDTGSIPLKASYLGDDVNWTGYSNLTWMDNSQAEGFWEDLWSAERDHLLRFSPVGAPGKPSDASVANLEDSRSSEVLTVTEAPLHFELSITRTAEGLLIEHTMGELGAGTPAVSLSYLDTNTLDAVDVFDTFLISFQGFVEVIIDDVQIGLVGGQPQTWNGYAVDENGIADTGAWMGMVYVGNDPWVYVYDLGAYTYITDDSGWVYVPKPM